MKKVYDVELIKYISLLENLGKVRIKDLFQYNGMLCCIVDKKDVSLLVGLEGRKIKKIQAMLNKKIKVIGYSPDIKDFVKDFIYPIKVDNIEKDNREENNNSLILHCKDRETKGLLIGRGGKGLVDLQAAISRYFKIDSIKVK